MTHRYAVDQGILIDPEVDAFGIDYATVLALLADDHGAALDATGDGPVYRVNIGNVFDEMYEYVIPESRIREAISEPSDEDWRNAIDDAPPPPCLPVCHPSDPRDARTDPANFPVELHMSALDHYSGDL